MLGLGDVAGGFDEGGELGVGDRRGRDEERVDGHLAHRPFAVGREGVRVLGAHEEVTARQIDQPAGATRGGGDGWPWCE